MKGHNTDRFFSVHLVTLVQVFFAVVIGGALIEFNDTIFAPEFSISFLSLLIVFLTSIMSWTGYHTSMGKYPYTHSISGILRLYSDVIIVVVYGFLLFSSTDSTDPHNIVLSNSYLFGFSGVFLLYIISGLLRRSEYNDKSASKTCLLRAFFITTLILAVSYPIIYINFNIDKLLLSQIFIWFPLLLMIVFRWWREWRKLDWRFPN